MQVKPVFIVIICILFIFTSSSFAAISPTLQTVLKDGIGVRPLGMGGAFTAIANDANAIFYNPAGVSHQEVSYLKGYQDLNKENDVVNEYTLIVSNSLGFGFWQRETIPGQGAEVFAYSYGHAGEDKISWGMNYKIVRDMATTESLGYSFDLGLLGQFDNKISWGLLFQDLVENMQIPVSIRAGLAYQVYPKLIVAGDAEFTDLKADSGASVSTCIGAESNITEGLILRCGYKRNRWTGGVTMKLPLVILEYALETSSGQKGSNALQLFGIRVTSQSL